MSTKKFSTFSESRAKQKVQSLLEDQRSLLERLKIHQRNFRRLVEQKANFGIAVPLNILNEIDVQEAEVASINKQLDQIDIEIAELTQGQQHLGKETNKLLPTVFNIEGVNYPIEVPYPFLEIRSRITPSRIMESTMRYAGGFEIKTVMRPSQSMQYKFYKHGRRISPIIDDIQKRVTVPIGTHIAVAAVYMQTIRKITIKDINSKDKAEGRWTLLSPSEPEENITVMEYPQGCNYYIVTSKLIFQERHEVWMVYPIEEVKKSNELPIKLWFYIDDWNVAPVVDKETYTLSFPILDIS